MTFAMVKMASMPVKQMSDGLHYVNMDIPLIKIAMERETMNVFPCAAHDGATFCFPKSMLTWHDAKTKISCDGATPTVRSGIERMDDFETRMLTGMWS